MDFISGNTHALASNLAANLAVFVPQPWLIGASLNAATVILFALGIALTLRRETTWEPGVQRLVPFGRTLFAVPLAIFGLQHFFFLNEVKDVVPSWMPWHIFWACLVGAALIAACLSILTDIHAGVAALLTGIMLYLFVLMLHLPSLIRNPHDSLAIEGPCRDFAMSGGALALAATLGAGIVSRSINWLVTVARWFFAVPMVYFGVEHFLHPEFAPGVPLQVPMPSWVPWHVALSYGMGAVLVVGGVCILANKGARVAAAWLGVAFLALVACIYLPMEIIHPSTEISGELDQVAEKLAMSGAAFFVAGAMAREGKQGARALQVVAESLAAK